MGRSAISKVYAWLAFIIAFVALFSGYSGDATPDIVRKMLIAPMGILASIGLRTYFPEAEDATRGPWTQLEYQVLNNLLLAASTMLVCMPWDTTDIPAMIQFVLGMATMVTVCNMVWFLYDRRKRSSRS